MKQYGYGHDFTFFDNYIAEKFGWKKPDNIKYNNWYPFKSPKGIWMAFCNSSYSDIKIINLETGDVVIDYFYSYFDPEEKDLKRNDKKNSWYASHTNIASYVPAYIKYLNEFHDRQKYYTAIPDYYVDNSFQEDWIEKNVEPEIKYAPFAFNGWTIWAADYEIYLDIIDLSKVDEGIIRRYDIPPYELPISLGNDIRQFINFEIDVESPGEELYEWWQPNILTETKGLRKTTGNQLSKDYNKTFLTIEDKPPYQIYRDEYLANKNNT